MAGACTACQLAETWLLPGLSHKPHCCRPGWCVPLLLLRLHGNLCWQRLGTVLVAEQTVLPDNGAGVAALPCSWGMMSLQRLRLRLELRSVCGCQVDDVWRLRIWQWHCMRFLIVARSTLPLM
jgi:hypothetical protein